MNQLAEVTHIEVGVLDGWAFGAFIIAVDELHVESHVALVSPN